ncbi:hypothetical protein PS15m_004037 [Mucor circinelloides]
MRATFMYSCYLQIITVKHCIHRPLFDSLILMQLLPTATKAPASAIHFSVFEFHRSIKLDVYASVHAFKKAPDNYNQCFHKYKPDVKALPHIFNSMVVIYNSIRKHAWDLVFAACLLKQMQCYACHDAPRLAIAMDGNFSLKRKKIATFTTTAAVAATTDEGVFEPCLREKQVYGTTAEVMEFEQESYVSKDECAIEELDSEFKVLNSQVGVNSNRWDENGVFNVSCARHGSVMRLYDIYKGEGRKYALAGLKHVLNSTPTDQKLTIMYDIVCACVGRFEHAFPELKESRHVKYGVPIFHAYAHSASLERFWSYADHFVSQVRSMTAKNRKSTLIDLADHFNDLKMDALPLQIKQKWVKAKANIEAMNMNVATFNALAWQWQEHVKHVSKKVANLNPSSIVAEMEEQLTEEDDEYKFLEAAYQSLVINQPGFIRTVYVQEVDAALRDVMIIINNRNGCQFTMPSRLDDSQFIRQKRKLQHACYNLLRQVLRHIVLAIVVLEIKLTQSQGIKEKQQYII